MSHLVTRHRKFYQLKTYFSHLHLKKPYDWNYTTTSQPGLNGRSFPYPRGKILGGSSSISKQLSIIPHHREMVYTFWTRSDGMVYNTGSKDDWDHVSRITGDPAWTWDAMAPYRDLNQRYVAPNDGHDDVSRTQLSSLSILIVSSRQISTSHRRTVVTGRCVSVFPGSRSPLIQELSRPSMNRVFHSSFPSSGT